MKPISRKIVELMLPVVLLGLAGCAGAHKSSTSVTTDAQNTASGTITIDEYQIMWMVGGDIGGGTLEFQGQSHKFEMGGLKLGGFGIHKVKLDGDVWDLKDVADFPGVYAEAEAGFTVAHKGQGDFWLVNDKGVKLRLKSPSSKGIALDLGVEGVDIRLK